VKFANALRKFIANEFARQSFTRPLYQRPSNTFGHIAGNAPTGIASRRPLRDCGPMGSVEAAWSLKGDAGRPAGY
jgi:hypothetical protein